MLDRKDKVRLFEQKIGKDDELSHQGGEGDFGGLTPGAEALIKSFEDWIMTGCRESRHIEGKAHMMPTTGDMALAPELAAITIKRSQAGERGGLSFGERSQFGHKSYERRGGQSTDALDLLETNNLLRKGHGLFKLEDKKSFESLELFFEEEDGFANENGKAFVARFFKKVFALNHLLDKLLAVFNEGREFLLKGLRWEKRLRIKGVSKLHKDMGINFVRFGEAALGFGEITDLTRINSSNGDVGLMSPTGHQRCDSALLSLCFG